MSNDLQIPQAVRLITALQNRMPSRFSQRPVPEDLLLEIARTSLIKPAEYNLSATEVVVLDDPDVKQLCALMTDMEDRIIQAPSVLVVLSKIKLDLSSAEKILDEQYQGDQLSQQIFLDKTQALKNRYAGGPFGSVKKIVEAVKSIFQPQIPSLYDRRDIVAYARSEAHVSVGFLLALAASHSLNTFILSSFDEKRVKRLLKVPKNYEVISLIAVGYPLEEGVISASDRGKDVRVHRNLYGSK